MADDNGDDDDGDLHIEVPADTAMWRWVMMRDQKRMERAMTKFVTKEMFDAKVGPMQRVMWLIFTVVTSALVMAVLGLIVQSSRLK